MDDEHDDGPDDSASYGLVCPFWTDADAYTDRDRDMFTAGYEFAQILDHIEHNEAPLSKPIHRENESRIRLACGRFKRRCEIAPCDAELDPVGTWSFLEIESGASIE